MKRVIVTFVGATVLSACSLVGSRSNTPTPKDLMSARVAQSGKVYTEALIEIERNYYTPINPERLTSLAIEFIVEKLNEHGDVESTTPLPCERKETMLGIMFSKFNGLTTVSRVAYRSPAYFAGIEIGNTLLAINGKSVTFATMHEVTELLVCEAQEPIILTLLEREYIRTVSLFRDRVHFNTRVATIIEPNIGYLYLSNLNAEVDGIEALLAILELKEQGAQKFILDLRSMSGGNLVAGRVFLSAFLKPGSLIVSTSQEVTKENSYRIGPIAAHLREPLVVLTNQFTTSLGEVIAMALQDYGRATIIGEQTVGYGTTVRRIPLEPQGALILPISLYYGPHGESIEDRGVVPDVLIENTNPVAHYVPGMRDDILDAALSHFRSF